MIYIQFFFCFGAFKCCGPNCWYKIHFGVLHEMYSMYTPLLAFFLTFKSFWLCLIVFVPVIRTNDAFLRNTMIGVDLNAFLNALLIFHIYQCLLICLIFGKVGRKYLLLKMELHQFSLTELISLNCVLFQFGFKWYFHCTIFPQIS